MQERSLQVTEVMQVAGKGKGNKKPEERVGVKSEVQPPNISWYTYGPCATLPRRIVVISGYLAAEKKSYR